MCVSVCIYIYISREFCLIGVQTPRLGQMDWRKMPLVLSGAGSHIGILTLNSMASPNFTALEPQNSIPVLLFARG